MEKRTLLALVLSVMVLVVWGHFVQKNTPPAPSDQPTTEPAAEGPLASLGLESPDDSSAESRLSLPETQATEERLLKVETPLYSLVLSNRGARLESVRLVQYKDADGLPLELLPEEARALTGGPLSLVTVPSAPGQRLAEERFEVEGLDLPLEWEVQTPEWENPTPEAEELTPEAEDPTPEAEELTPEAEDPTPKKVAIMTLEAEDRPAEVRFLYADSQGRAVEKLLRFDPARYTIDMEVQASLPEARQVFTTLGPGFGQVTVKGNRYQFGGRALVQVGGEFERLFAEKVEEIQVFQGGQVVPIGAMGLESSYFATLLLPADGGLEEVAVWPESRSEEDPPLLRLGASVDGRRMAFQVYFGPKDLEILESVRPDLRGVVDFGKYLGWMAEILLRGLRAIHGVVGNWGVAIILLTAVIRVLLFPLSYKQMLMSKQMQRLAPKFKELEQKYKRPTGDRAERMKRQQQMQAEKMEFMRKEGVNPASGCLPLLVQLPFLYAFYSLLGAAIELRQAPFMLWIQDLSLRDPTYMLPILMGISMIVQQAIMPTTADPNQKRMMMAMPVVFTFLFVNFPSGLVLYWLTSNLMSIGQQYLLNRYTSDSKPAGGPRGPKRGGNKPGKVAGRKKRG